jgi:hypothetical protein
MSEPSFAESTPGRSRLGLAGLVILFALPLLLRLWPIGHGLPDNYVPDTHLVRSALGMAKDRTLVPPVGEYSTYPNLLAYALLPVYAGEYALGRMLGWWGGAEEFGNVLLVEPWKAHLPARVLFALIASLTPWAIFRATRAMGLRAGAWAAAWLAATCLLHVHFSTQERPWAPLTLFFTLTAWGAAVHARDGTLKPLILSGVAAGAAFATHQVGVLALGISGLAWLLGPRMEGVGIGGRVKRGFLCVLAFALVGVLVGHPYLLAHGLGSGADDAVIQEVTARGDAKVINIGGQGMRLAFRFDSAVAQFRALIGYDLALVILGLLGLGAGLRSRAARPAILFLLAYGLFFHFHENNHVRYLLPLSVLLAIPSGFAVEDMWPDPRKRWFVVFLLALPLVQSVRLGVVLRRTDTRALATLELDRLRREGALPEGPIGVDWYGPVLPLDQGALERLATWRPLTRREAHRLALYEAGIEPPGIAGFDAIPLAELIGREQRTGEVWIRKERLGESAPEDVRSLLITLDVNYVITSKRTRLHQPTTMMYATIAPDDERTSHGWGGPPLSVTPGRTTITHPSNAWLPVEMRDPARDIWEVVRPGPKISGHAALPD